MWESAFEDRLQRDVALAELTTVRVGGPAHILVRPKDADDIAALLVALARDGVNYRVLGGGSNLLPSDDPVDDVVIHPVLVTGVCPDGERLHVAAGHTLSGLVAAANRLGLAGAHVLAGIPGQVGGALRMNAGGRYGDIGSLVETVHVCLRGGERAVLSRDDLGFGYRTSTLPEGAVICGATLKLTAAADVQALRRESGRILKEKNRAQPTTTWNFGCMWKNPKGFTAGVLVQEAGLLGHIHGGARISPRHGNFVENVDHAKASDVIALMTLAEDLVFERSGVRLEREVQVWT